MIKQLGRTALPRYHAPDDTVVGGRRLCPSDRRCGALLGKPTISFSAGGEAPINYKTRAGAGRYPLSRKTWCPLWRSTENRMMMTRPWLLSFTVRRVAAAALLHGQSLQARRGAKTIVRRLTGEFADVRPSITTTPHWDITQPLQNTADVPVLADCHLLRAASITVDCWSVAHSLGCGRFWHWRSLFYLEAYSYNVVARIAV